MLEFGTLVAQYNSSALSLANGQYGPIAIDSAARIIQDHSTSSIKVGDGTDILGIYVEDAISGGGENGIVPLAVRQDALSSSTSDNGDFATLKVNAAGALYVTKQYNTEYAEDSEHTSGEYGNFVLAVRNDAGGSLVSDDGDYAPLQVDASGNLRVNAQIDFTPGTEGDKCSDATGDGEVPSVGTSAWVDIVTIAVADSTTYFIEEVDGSADKLCSFRLVVIDDTTITKYIRVFNVPENTGTTSLNFGRAIEVVGGTTISLKLQAKRLRSGTPDANCSGGINGYVL